MHVVLLASLHELGVAGGVGGDEHHCDGNVSTMKSVERGDEAYLQP